MATWTLTGTGLPLTFAGADVIGDVPLSGAKPADFNPGAVSEVRINRTLVIGADIGDDSVDDTQSCQVRNSSGAEVATVLGSTVNRPDAGTFPITMTDTSIANAPDDTGNYVHGGVVAGGVWATFQANMKNDGGTVELTAVTVEIDYTPGAPPVASFNASATTVEQYQPVDLTDTSSGSPTTWLWGLDGGATPSGLPDTANYQTWWDTPGVKSVTLQVTNAFGSDTSDPVLITVVAATEARIWNGSEWVGGESWNGSAWVTPEIWNGAAWVPLAAPP